MINKELLSEVLKKELNTHDSAYDRVVDSVTDNYTGMFHINYVNVHGFIHGYFINIHELAHKCKEWVLMQGYYIMTAENEDGVSVKLFSSKSLVKEFPPVSNDKYIFNYCEWIRENR